MKTSHIITLIAFWVFNCPVFGQTPLEQAKAIDKEIKERLKSYTSYFERPDTSIISGGLHNAIAISFIPDARVIGVHLLVDKGCEFSVDDMAMPTKSYFDYYGLPAIIVKQEKPLEGNSADVRIYINGECFVGDMKTGGLSLYEIQHNHEKWFEKIKSTYKKGLEYK